jgi:hypothetical protein
VRNRLGSSPRATLRSRWSDHRNRRVSGFADKEWGVTASSPAMKMKRIRHQQPKRSAPVRFQARPRPELGESTSTCWPGEGDRSLTVIGAVVICLCTAFIYWQTFAVPPMDYEDPFYLVHSPYVHVNAAFSRLGSVWNEPYFANFHPVTTTTWLLDRELADKSKPFDARPFRISHLIYASIGACLLLPLYRRLGIPTLLAVMGAILYATHPIHTEVVAWLSARKDLISLLFILLSFLVWLQARDAKTPNVWRMWYSLTIVLALLAVLSKPVGVVAPCLFVAYEFCSGPHVSITRWRWRYRHRHPLLTRTIALTATVVLVGVFSALIFRSLLARNPLHGGWLIFVPLGFLTVNDPCRPNQGGADVIPRRKRSRTTCDSPAVCRLGLGVWRRFCMDFMGARTGRGS